ncbi:MAG: TIGR02285 family protein [Desulfobacter sp.]|nr:MAG: TIGR02285 family protein [Desulfobacter sp.]
MNSFGIQKRFVFILVVFLSFVSLKLEAKERITWMVLDWKPWMIIEGEDKGSGRFNHILNVAQENLPGYDHVTEKMNWARFWYEVENNKNVCYLFGLKTGKRDDLVYYSAPHTFVLPNAIIMKKETAKILGDPESYSIVQLLGQNSLKGYAEKNRSFTRKIDSLIANQKTGSNLTRVSESAESLVKMVIMGRIDYTIEYPIVSSYYQKKIGLPGKLVSIPITEMPPFSYVYMNCTKNEWGKQVIEKWNGVLQKIKPTKAYRKITEIGHTQEKQLVLMRKYYDAFIQEQK